VIRGRLLGGQLRAQHADEAIAALVELEMDQIDVLPLAHRIWEPRDNLTAYAAAYLAVAEDLGRGCSPRTSASRASRGLVPGAVVVVDLVSSKTIDDARLVNLC
jgi:hypothetical protein